MRPLLLALAAWLLLGCSVDPCYNPMYCPGDGPDADTWQLDHLKSTLVIDPVLEPDEVDAVLAAAAAWEAALPGRIHIEFVFLAADESVANRSVVRRAWPRDHFADTWLATTDGSRIALSEQLRAHDYMGPALVHEFGHYFGLGHETDSSDIMFPATTDHMPTGPTPKALADLDALYSW